MGFLSNLIGNIKNNFSDDKGLFQKNKFVGFGGGNDFAKSQLDLGNSNIQLSSTQQPTYQQFKPQMETPVAQPSLNTTSSIDTLKNRIKSIQGLTQIKVKDPVPQIQPPEPTFIDKFNTIASKAFDNEGIVRQGNLTPFAPIDDMIKKPITNFINKNTILADPTSNNGDNFWSSKRGLDAAEKRRIQESQGVNPILEAAVGASPIGMMDQTTKNQQAFSPYVNEFINRRDSIVGNIQNSDRGDTGKRWLTTGVNTGFNLLDQANQIGTNASDAYRDMFYNTDGSINPIKNTASLLRSGAGAYALVLGKTLIPSILNANSDSDFGKAFTSGISNVISGTEQQGNNGGDGIPAQIGRFLGGIAGWKFNPLNKEVGKILDTVIPYKDVVDESGKVIIKAWKPIKNKIVNYIATRGSRGMIEDLVDNLSRIEDDKTPGENTVGFIRDELLGAISEIGSEGFMDVAGKFIKGKGNINTKPDLKPIVSAQPDMKLDEIPGIKLPESNKPELPEIDSKIELEKPVETKPGTIVTKNGLVLENNKVEVSKPDVEEITVYRTSPEVKNGDQVFTNKQGAEMYATPNEPVTEFKVRKDMLEPSLFKEKADAGIMTYKGDSTVTSRPLDDIFTSGKPNIKPEKIDIKPPEMEVNPSKIRDMKADGQAFEFYSPNIEENIDFETARSRLTSPRQAWFKSATDDINTELGLETKSYNAMGDWGDGAENTVVSITKNTPDYETVRYTAAKKGKVGNQKATIPFRVEQDGPNTLYEIDTAGKDMVKLRSDLDAAGIKFRTLVDQTGGEKVFVFDPDNELEPQVISLITKYGTDARRYKGRGEFLGSWNTRIEGTKVYNKVISDYEAKNNRRNNGKSGNRVQSVDKPSKKISELPKKETKPISEVTPKKTKKISEVLVAEKDTKQTIKTKPSSDTTPVKKTIKEVTNKPKTETVKSYAERKGFSIKKKEDIATVRKDVDAITENIVQLAKREKVSWEGVIDEIQSGKIESKTAREVKDFLNFFGEKLGITEQDFKNKDFYETYFPHMWDSWVSSAEANRILGSASIDPETKNLNSLKIRTGSLKEFSKNLPQILKNYADEAIVADAGDKFRTSLPKARKIVDDILANTKSPQKIIDKLKASESDPFGFKNEFLEELRYKIEKDNSLIGNKSKMKETIDSLYKKAQKEQVLNRFLYGDVKKRLEMELDQNGKFVKPDSSTDYISELITKKGFTQNQLKSGSGLKKKVLKTLTFNDLTIDARGSGHTDLYNAMADFRDVGDNIKQNRIAFSQIKGSNKLDTLNKKINFVAESLGFGNKEQTQLYKRRLVSEYQEVLNKSGELDKETLSLIDEKLMGYMFKAKNNALKNLLDVASNYKLPDEWRKELNREIDWKLKEANVERNLVTKASEAIARVFFRAHLYFNPKSAIRQGIEATKLASGYIEPKYVMEGMASKNKGNGLREFGLDESFFKKFFGELDGKKGNKVGEKIDDIAGWGMKFFEDKKNNYIIAAFKAKATDLGYTNFKPGGDGYKYVRGEVMSVGNMIHSMNRPFVLKNNPILNTLLQYGQFKMKDYNYLMRNDVGNIAGKTAKFAAGKLTSALTLAALTGGSIAKTLKDDLNPLQIGPIASVTQDVYEQTGQLIEAQKELDKEESTYNETSVKSAKNRLIRTGVQNFVPAGIQTARVYDAVNLQKKGYSDTAFGNVRFLAPDKTTTRGKLDTIRSFAFGQSTTKEGQAYYNGGMNSASGTERNKTIKSIIGTDRARAEELVKDGQIIRKNNKKLQESLSKNEQKLLGDINASVFDKEGNINQRLISDKSNSILKNWDLYQKKLQTDRETIAETGEPMNPELTLPEYKLKIYHTLQTLPPGSEEEKKLREANEDWIYDYWDALGKYTENKRVIGVSGPAKPDKYKASPELQKKLDYYNTLEKNTGARSAYIKANPEIVDYWKLKNEQTNLKREQLGLAPIPWKDGGSSSSGGYGGWQNWEKADPNVYTYLNKITGGRKSTLKKDIDSIIKLSKKDTKNKELTTLINKTYKSLSEIFERTKK